MLTNAKVAVHMEDADCVSGKSLPKPKNILFRAVSFFIKSAPVQIERARFILYFFCEQLATRVIDGRNLKSSARYIAIKDLRDVRNWAKLKSAPSVEKKWFR